MPGENDINGKVGMDTTNFKTGVNELNAQIRSIETGFRASAAVMGDWSNTSKGLTARTDSLSDKLNLQKQKLSILNSEYKQTVSEQGASSKAAESLANQMYSVEKAISSTENELKRYAAQLDNVENKSKKVDFSGLKDGLSKVGSGALTGLKAAGTAIAGIGVAATAAAAGAVKLVSSAVESADELQRLSDVTGQSAEQLQIMQYQGKALGVELDTMTGAQAKLTKSMSSAKDGSGPAAQAYKQLGISVTDSSGQLRNSNDVFNEAITKLGQIQNPTERDALAMKILGKSAMELNPLIKAGGDQLSKMAEQAKNSGAVMSNEAVAGLDNFGDSLDAAKLSIKGMAGTMAAGALPVLNQFTGLLGGLTTSLSSALKTGDFSQFGTVLSSGVSGIVTQFSGMITQAVPVVSQVISSAIGAVVQALPQLLPVLTTGVLQVITSITTIMQTNGPQLITAGVQAISTLITGLTTALPQIMSAGTTTLLALVDALSAQLPTLIPVAVQAVITIVEGLVDNIPQIISAAINIIIALVEGIMNALPQLSEKIPEIIIKIIDALVGALPMLIDAAPKIIVSIIMGIISALPKLLEAGPKVITSLLSGLIEALPQLWEMGPKIIQEVGNALKTQDWPGIGKNLIDGIWEGIKNTADWLWNQVKDFFGDLLDKIKAFLGIKSPSKVFAGIGEYMAQGLSVGFTDNMKNVAKQMKGAIPTSFDIATNVNAVASSFSSAMRFMTNQPMFQPAFNGGYSLASGDTFYFYQTNNSPKAIGAAEAARQTRNVLRQAVLSSRRK